LGVPVYQLLGGKTVEHIDLGFVLMARPAEELVDDAKKRSASASADQAEDSSDTESSIRLALEMRKALGDGVRLMMDVNGNVELRPSAARLAQDGARQSGAH